VARKNEKCAGDLNPQTLGGQENGRLGMGKIIPRRWAAYAAIAGAIKPRHGLVIHKGEIEMKAAFKIGLGNAGMRRKLHVGLVAILRNRAALTLVMIGVAVIVMMRSYRANVRTRLITATAYERGGEHGQYQ
jgi:hypothetical protein